MYSSVLTFLYVDAFDFIPRTLLFLQNHLLSVFDNTRLVTFDEKVYDKILGINSQEGEQVLLDEPVNAQGNVEVWLGDLLNNGRRSLHGIIRTASVAIQDPSFNLLEFENTFPSQVGVRCM